LKAEFVILLKQLKQFVIEKRERIVNLGLKRLSSNFCLQGFSCKQVAPKSRQKGKAKSTEI
jgi:hypothetical protein